MPVKMLKIPIVRKSTDIRAVPTGKVLLVERSWRTLTPAIRPIIDIMPPPIPKKKRGFLSEIMAIIRVRTPKPCATGFKVELSLV